MRFHQVAREFDADGAHRDVDLLRARASQQIAVTEQHFFERVVVGQHGDDDLARCGLCRRRGDLGSFARQFLGTRARAVVYRDLVPGLEQIARHAASHGSQSDEPDFHLRSLLSLADRKSVNGAAMVLRVVPVRQ